MSELLLEWLNKDVGLSRKVKTFEIDFSSGYLFGELLNRRGLLSDQDFTDSFIDASTLAAKKQNMALLKSLFSTGPAKGMGVKFNDEVIHHVVNEDRGASLRLLFQLRKQFLDLPSGQAVVQKKTMKPRLVREKLGPAEEHFFEKSLQKLPRTAPRVVYECHNKKFLDEHKKQMENAIDEEISEAAAIKDNQLTFRNTRLQAMTEHRACVNEINMSNEEIWQATMRRKHANIERDLEFEKKTLRKDTEKINRVRARHQEDCGYHEDNDTHGIGWFEKNLMRIGIDTSEHAGRNDATIDASNAKEFYDKMTEQLPDQAKLKVECSQRMKKIKEQKKASDMAQRERDRRLRRQMVDQQSKQSEVEEQRQEDDLLRWLQEETGKYRKEALEYDMNSRFKLAAQEQKKIKQEALIKKSEQDMVEKAKNIAEKQVEREKEREAEREMERQKAAMRGANGLEELEVKEEVGEASSDEDISPFVVPKSPSARPNSATLAQERSMPTSPAAPDAVQSVPANSLVECIQDQCTSEYLFSRGNWGVHRPSAAHVQKWLEQLQSPMSQESVTQVKAADESRLGGFVRWVLELEGSQTKSPQLPKDYLPIIAITGNPIKYGNLGSSLKAAEKVCSEFGLELVEPRKVVEECVKLANEVAEEPEWPPLARMHQLGKVFIEESSKSCDGTVPMQVFAEMVFRKIELLSAPPPPKPEDEEDLDPKAKGKAKAKAKAKGKQEEEPKEPVRPNGVLLLGYLSEFGQLSSWEMAFQGYASPLLRINDSDSDLQAQVSSIIAPWKFQEIDVRSYAKFSEVVAEPAMQLLRLRHASHEELCSKVLSEAGNEKAWEVGDFLPVESGQPPPDPKAQKGKKPAVATEPEPTSEIPAILCQGYESESLQLTNPVDRAWLYEDSQALVQTFAEPLKICKDLVPECQTEGEETETAEAALCRQVLEFVTQLRKTSVAEVQEVVEPAAEEQGENIEQVVADTEKEAECEPEAISLGLGGPVWETLPKENKEQMRKSWLQSTSTYVVTLNSAMGDLHTKAAGYGQAIKEMQRSFLEFLQRPDEKIQSMGDYLQVWPQRSHGRHVDDVAEEIEELSDHMWQFADRRRAESVEHHARLVMSGFWEDHSHACLNLGKLLYNIEWQRYDDASLLLLSAYGHSPFADDAREDIFDTSLEGLSSLDELLQWIRDLTQRVASAPLRLPSESIVDFQGVAEDADQKQSGSAILEDSNWQLAELRGALVAEKLRLMQRLLTIEAWMVARLQAMREQLDEAFRRMDDWIRDRVRVENDAIKVAISIIEDGQWEVEDGQLATSGRLRSTPGSKSGGRRAPGSPSGAFIRRKRREVLKALEPKTLDVDVLYPPKLKIAAPSASSELPIARASEAASQGRWSQDMLRSLLQNIVDRSSGIAAVSAETLLVALLEQRSSGFKFDVDLVPPSWVKRSEATLAAFCSALLNPDWGNVAIDLAEFILALTFHDRRLPWPTIDALVASRKLIESTVESAASYPDVQISEQLFMDLPLWDDRISAQLSDEPNAEQLPSLKRWIFRVLLCFEKDGQARVPVTLGRPSNDSISARRMFTYLGLRKTPMEGLQAAMKLLLVPQPKKVVEGEAEETEKPPEILVQHLWRILYSRSGRPFAGTPAPPDLADFCTALVPPAPAEPVEETTKKGKPGKGAPSPSPEPLEVAPPQPPDKLTVVFDEAALVRKKAVLNGLCTHGGLLCHRRALGLFFPVNKAPVALVSLHSSKEILEAEGLAVLIPSPPPTPEVTDAVEGGDTQ